MKRGQVFVRGKLADDSFGSIDVLDLDDESFRVFTLDMLDKAGLVVKLQDKVTCGEHLVLRARRAKPNPAARGRGKRKT